MSTSYNYRDTPLRRFNAFWWGLAVFGIFGLVSVVVYGLSNRAPSPAELSASERKEQVDTVFAKQKDQLTEKELEPGKTKQVAPDQVFDKMSDLAKAPVSSSKDFPKPAGDKGDPGKGAELYKAKTCFTCHGADGNTPIAPMFPKLGGKEAAYLAKKMKDIKSGAYTTPLTPQMKPFIDQVSDEEIDHIAAWLAEGSK